MADVGVESVTSTVVATRGERLALSRIRSSKRGRDPVRFIAEVLGIVEIDTDNRIVAAVEFDSDDIDAAFEELEARYLAGEAAAHAHTWSVIARTYAAFNRHEILSTTPDSVYIDHRSATTVASGDWPQLSVRRGTSLRRSASTSRPCIGWTNSEPSSPIVLTGTSQEGLDAEWRMIALLRSKAT